MFGHRHEGHRMGRGHGHGRDHGFGPRGGWEQWGERLEQGFAELFGEHGRGGGGGRRRMFDGSELRLVLLKMIADTPRHGYELIKAVEELTGGAYAPSPGVVYPALTMLNEMELIEEQASEGARKRFAVTEAGRAHLAERAELVAALMARLTGLGEHRARTDRVPIRRAMRNLRTVLQNRLEANDLSEEAAHDVAELIDEVVRKIERLK
ncbi:PadR family transcriptional regulator [Sphingomonas sp. MA1305]|uniref:PadR family transcriptional regulator n=1 Tax=unclassified Sphingomonas TaxID=196159 RepID=UPI0018DF533A|nr:PadR family transcriptional regulator [Sphingomonas sp. MA1305]MBI0475072.1 PadR family transcriptional regulator [Sphingomonas sp. MA1305]